MGLALNYRHAFHAGNHADVLKHSILLELLDALVAKPSAWFALDTHAGAGDYRLPESGEANSGIRRLQTSAAAPLQRYLAAIARHNPDGALRHYPGSPRLIADTLRADDRLATCELADAPYAQLRAAFARDSRIGVHQRDGYAAVKALLPPAQKRGLVLIDPPYEAKLAEFDAILAALHTGLARWPQGMFVVWYPLKLRRSVQPFLRTAAQLPAKGALIAELCIRPADSPLRLNGSGILLLNPPWQCERRIAPILDALRAALGEHGASNRLEWLHQPG